MEHVARRVFGTGPDRDRQQHHVHHRKAGHAQPHQQLAPLPVGLGGREQAGVKFVRLIPQPLQRQDQRFGGQGRFGIHADPPQRQVHPRGPDARQGGKAAFHRGNAGRAMRAGQRQHDAPACRRRQRRQPFDRGDNRTGRAGRGRGFQPWQRGHRITPSRTDQAAGRTASRRGHRLPPSASTCRG